MDQKLRLLFVPVSIVGVQSNELHAFPTNIPHDNVFHLRSIAFEVRKSRKETKLRLEFLGDDLQLDLCRRRELLNHLFAVLRIPENGSCDSRTGQGFSNLLLRSRLKIYNRLFSLFKRSF